ncbi:hypothetical protein HPB47_008902 [Ixodes persulcatus]|uniref:Uncharacterized protein n=1 Tax=Ixodes persulcatus TaxID=34615 RepID=A0AC60P3G5_IXOPE|nr:hypothetical protein HPB47_008902 [Ixodes persulcatus]
MYSRTQKKKLHSKQELKTQLLLSPVVGAEQLVGRSDGHCCGLPLDRRSVRTRGVASASSARCHRAHLTRDQKMPATSRALAATDT